MVVIRSAPAFTNLTSVFIFEENDFMPSEPIHDILTNCFEGWVKKEAKIFFDSFKREKYSLKIDVFKNSENFQTTLIKSAYDKIPEKLSMELFVMFCCQAKMDLDHKDVEPAFRQFLDEKFRDHVLMVTICEFNENAFGKSLVEESLKELKKKKK